MRLSSPLLFVTITTNSFLVLSSLLCLLLLITSPSSSLFISAFKLPNGHLEQIAYERVYKEPPFSQAYYCVTLADEQYSVRKLRSQDKSVAGCLTPSYIQTLPLYTFDYDAWADIALSNTWNITNTAPDLINKRKSIEPFLSSTTTTQPFSLVIPPNFQNSQPTKKRFTCGFIFALLRTLQESHGVQIQGIFTYYNQNTYTDVNTKTAVLGSICDLSGFADASPLWTQSPYYSPSSPTTNKRSWNNQNSNQDALGGLMFKPFPAKSSSTMTIVEIDFTDFPAAQSFYTDSLYAKAKFNLEQSSKQQQSGSIAVDFVTQTNTAMQYTYNPLSAASLARNYSCIEIGTCLPVGGQSVFASTRPQELSRLDLDSDRNYSSSTPKAQLTESYTADSTEEYARKFRFRRSVAIVIPSTSTSSLFHANVPAANGAASGVVAGLAIADALMRNENIVKLLATQSYKLNIKTSLSSGENATVTWEPTQVHFLFAVGEEYGLIGSGRFITELLTLNCSVPTRYNQTDEFKRICATPLYRFLNFTAIDLTEYTHVFHLEQLALGSDIYLHTDQVSGRTNTVPSSSVLQDGKGYYGGEFDFASSTAQQSLRTFMSSTSSIGGSLQLSSEPQLPPGSLFSFYETAATKNALLNDAASSGAVLASLKSFEKRYNGQFNETILASITAFDNFFTDPNYQSQADVANRTEVTSSNPKQLIKKASQSIVNFLTNLWTNEFMDFATDVKNNFDVTLEDSNDQPSIDAMVTALSSSSPIEGSSNTPVNDTYVENFWNCMAVQSKSSCAKVLTETFKTYYPGVYQGALSTATLPQRIIEYHLADALSKLDLLSQTGGTTTTTTTTTTTQVPSSPSSSSSSSSSCNRVCNFTEFCSSKSGSSGEEDQQQTFCIPRRVWFISAFSTLADYSTGRSFLNSTPTDLKNAILPRALIDEANSRVPFWTESFWNGLETRSAQRQMYNSDGFLMGVSLAVTVVIGLLTFGSMKYVF